MKGLQAALSVPDVAHRDLLCHMTDHMTHQEVVSSRQSYDSCAGAEQRCGGVRTEGGCVWPGLSFILVHAGRRLKIEGAFCFGKTMGANLLREELVCSVCQNIYSDPVILSCGHNYCRVCIEDVLDKQEKEAAAYSCPDCRTAFRERPCLLNNTKLGNIAELSLALHPKNDNSGIFCNLIDGFRPGLPCDHRDAFLSGVHLLEEHIRGKPNPSHQTMKCSVHGKISDHYCFEDKICVCKSCCIAEDHWEHRVEPLLKAAQKKKKRLRNHLDQLNSEKDENYRKIECLKEHVGEVQDKASCVGEQVTALIGDIKKQLEDLEKRVLNELSRQKAQVFTQVSDLIRKLDMKNKELSKEIRHFEALCNMDDPLEILHLEGSELLNLFNVRFQEQESTWNCEKMSEAVKPLDETMISALFETSLQNLIDCLPLLKVKRGFSKQESSAISLDVDTSFADIIVSDDLKILTGCRRHWQSQKETDQYVICQALSTRSFSSGQYYWEVETSKSGNWKIGVSYPRKQSVGLCDIIGSNGESWCLWKWGMYSSVKHNGKQHHVSLDPFTHRYGIYLDYEEGRLSFYQLCEPVQHLYTFTADFTEPLHAAFFVYMDAWVRIWS
uniref:Uncharacterized protein n=1 Tax=Leptobrachium leishanense TaxID=445787 RepID=A0A8C5PWJ5_9ANUR